MTLFYIASGWAGAQIGTQAQPFRALDTTRWTAINTALALDDVTIYFSARNAASDTDMIHSSTGSGSTPDVVDVTKRTDTSAHVLTLDGKSFYNTNDTTPSWSAYSGTSRCKVRNILSQNSAHTKYSNITCRGLKASPAGDVKAISVCGDNWLVDACDFSHSSFVSGGAPCVLVVPTADAAHEGSGDYAPACSNIIFRNCLVHDTQGEGIYVGGGGTSPGAAGSGYPSHDSITIEGCTISYTGQWAPQGDGIDVKGGITNLIIRNNILHHIANVTGTDSEARAIVCQGMYLNPGDLRKITGNLIYACSNIDEAAIALVNSWGVPGDTLIANNIIYDISRNGGQVGIRIYQSSGTITIVNNTIAFCASHAISADSGSTVVVRNNVFFSNNSSGSQVSYSGTVTASNYNAYNGSIGYGSEGANSIAITSAAFVNSASRDFSLVAGSTLINAGTTVASVTTDYAGTARPQGAAYDIGAYEYVSVGPFASVISGSIVASGSVRFA